jgi:hypothetical protein
MADLSDSSAGAGESDIFAKAAADSAAGATVFGSDSAAGMVSPAGGGAAKAKICCVCGVDLKGKTRFKDSDGKYWCYECGMADSMRKHPVPCPDCKRSFMQGDMGEFKGVWVCKECLVKRQQAFKRDQARKAAAEEEERRLEAAQRRKMMIIVVVVGVLAIYGAVQVLVKLLQ